MTSPTRVSLKLIATASLLIVSSLSMAQSGSKENGGLDLPDLDAINRRPIIEPQSATINEPRQPSYQSTSKGGTQVTEYVDPNHAKEIHVKSGLGTSYNMSAPTDETPHIPDGSIQRVPTVPVLKF